MAMLSILLLVGAYLFGYVRDKWLIHEMKEVQVPESSIGVKCSS